jgi:hypothetical protein
MSMHPDRKAERLFSHLADFKGVPQVDGYNAYPKLAERGGVELAFCWVHMRRNFYELATAGPAPIASEALKHIAAFYAIEKEIRGRSAERRLVRQQKSRPLADAFEVWLRAKLALIGQKIKLAEAIRYALSRWQGLTRFIDDGRIELDNNTIERSIRGIKLCRKNALFAGSDGGAEHWAVIASLVETCKINDVDPLAYLTDFLTRIVNGHPNRHIDLLLPWAYRAQAQRDHSAERMDQRTPVHRTPARTPRGVLYKSYQAYIAQDGAPALSILPDLTRVPSLETFGRRPRCKPNRRDGPRADSVVSTASPTTNPLVMLDVGDSLMAPPCFGPKGTTPG